MKQNNIVKEDIKTGDWHKGLLDTALNEIPDSNHSSPNYQDIEYQLSATEIEEIFPNHVVECLIGRGGYSIVYLVRNKLTNEKFAAKYIPEVVLSEFSFRERLVREYEILSKLDHPNIIKVYDLEFRSDGSGILLMEFVDGQNLAKHTQRKTYTVEQSLTLVKYIASAIEYLHQKGICHRDVKPSNIVVRKDGAIKLVDFGLARQHTSLEENVAKIDFFTTENERIGTPVYSAPELTQEGVSIANSADLYSLGVILYELLMGSMPLGVFNYPTSSGIGHRKIDQLINKALKKNPTERFHSAAKFEQIISQILSYKFNTKRSKKSSWKFLLTGSFLAAIVGIATLGYKKDQHAQTADIYFTQNKITTDWLKRPPSLKKIKSQYFLNELKHQAELVGYKPSVNNSLDISISSNPELSSSFRVSLNGAKNNTELLDYLLSQLQERWKNSLNHWVTKIDFSPKFPLTTNEQIELQKTLLKVITADKLISLIVQKISTSKFTSPIQINIDTQKNITILINSLEPSLGKKVSSLVTLTIRDYQEQKLIQNQNDLHKNQQDLVIVKDQIDIVDKRIRAVPWAVQYYDVFATGLGKENMAIAAYAIQYWQYISKYAVKEIDSIILNLEDKKHNLLESKVEYLALREITNLRGMINYRNTALVKNKNNDQVLASHIVVNATESEFIEYLRKLRSDYERANLFYLRQFYFNKTSLHQKIKNPEYFLKLVNALRKDHEQMIFLQKKATSHLQTIETLNAEKKQITLVLAILDKTNPLLSKTFPPELKYFQISTNTNKKDYFIYKHLGFILTGVIIGWLVYRYTQRQIVIEKTPQDAFTK